ncbi:hypothetical protein [Mesorhizobium sp. M1A.F.Ca.IN.022.06.1.1]|uniref:hypothetical protein n=1 Tax=Mesorhizobium sp. M1A.F.Ca.IN.022.06.1.1 TaxID=2493680 RepID=UPI001FE17F6A|nr:hypothetical protein [Mesorhizobium sp. M1A.F.Ca.IN.022.06.1.1]
MSDTAGNGAGILAGAPGNGEYGWIQVKGVATLTTTLVSGASGRRSSFRPLPTAP